MLVLKRSNPRHPGLCWCCNDGITLYIRTTCQTPGKTPFANEVLRLFWEATIAVLCGVPSLGFGNQHRCIMCFCVCVDVLWLFKASDMQLSNLSGIHPALQAMCRATPNLLRDDNNNNKQTKEGFVIRNLFFNDNKEQNISKACLYVTSAVQGSDGVCFYSKRLCNKS